MKRWNSFSRIESAFNKEIPDKVPRYEGSIEIPELNPILRGQLDCSTAFLFSPKQFDLFHKNPELYTAFKKYAKKGRNVLKGAIPDVKSISEIHRNYKYDMFAYIPGIPILLKDVFFQDFYGEDQGTILRGPGDRLVWKISHDGAHTRHGFFNSPEEWDKYMHLEENHPGNYILVENAVEKSKELDIVPIFTIFGCGFFEELCGIFGFETLFKLLVKNKEFIKKIVNQISQYSISVAENVIERGGKYIYMTCDLGFKGRSIISPKMFQEFFKPGIKEFCKKVHDLGGYVMMHSCGYIMELLPDIIDTGIDALHPIEKAAGNDIVEIKKKYQNKITLVGNVPIPLLTHGTAKENFDYVKNLLAQVSKDGGHIISSSHSVTEWCKLENFEAYNKAVDQFGNYPIIVN